MSHHYDVIINGAGMVGASLALALSQQHSSLTIALIEANTPQALQVHEDFDLRVSALTQSSENLLRRLGIWQALDPLRLSPFSDMVVWETDTDELHFDSADMGQATLGHLIENRHLQTVSLRLCQQQHNIDIISPASPVAYQPYQLTLDNGQQLTASLIIAADGARSQLRQWAGIQQRYHAYQQRGLVCTVSTEAAHQATAWQRFLAEGPLAFLPQPDRHRCSIVWSVNNDTAEHLLALPDDAFNHQLQLAWGDRLGQLTVSSQRAAFPLLRQHAKHYVTTGFALVGDAAHSIHPLAGQGVNIGLLDVASLTDIIAQAYQQRRNIGSLHTLQKYQRQRYADNLLMQLSMDVFKQCFSSTLPISQWLRRFGLRSSNRHVWLKNIIMQQASSRSFARPALADDLLNDQHL